ncbi:VOC family protein [Candidatus Kaiserbacteria bacterium]|nr:VOC family protein [Candidatus Kaiserbacteria bacterium]
MIAHATIAVSDYQRAKEFYKKALAPLGYTNNMEFGDTGGFNDGKNTDFWIARKVKVVPMHVAFEAKNKAQVDNFYKEALAAGAKDNGKPGYRTDYWIGYYAAFVHDADGNNVEAVWYDYSQVK